MIVRSPRPASHFTIVSNSVVRDSRLSWKARGILFYLLSLPDNWSVSSDHLIRSGPDGRHAVLAGLKELETAGYIQRVKTQRDNGQWNTVTYVFDSPNQPVPTSGFPTSEKRTAIEETTKNELVEEISSRTYICEHCSNYGTTVTSQGDLIQCDCGY